MNQKLVSSVLAVVITGSILPRAIALGIVAEDEIDIDTLEERLRAENVAAGCASESCAIALWAGSAGHRQNMLLADVRKFGLASSRGYWCLVLGR